MNSVKTKLTIVITQLLVGIMVIMHACIWPLLFVCVIMIESYFPLSVVVVASF